MAYIILQEVLGDNLVKEFLFDHDFFSECTTLPSPNQLKYKILIKNKKLRPVSTPQLLKTKVRIFLKPLQYVKTVREKWRKLSMLAGFYNVNLRIKTIRNIAK